MTTYKNFTVDFPQRLAELHRRFWSIASSADLDVSYALMRLAAASLLPYERLEGTSGARRRDIRNSPSIRTLLELDKRFRESSYCLDTSHWSLLDVADFELGPRGWLGDQREMELVVCKVLQMVRHSVAHSNLFFGGATTIEHIYLGSRRERDPDTGKYRVLRCTLEALNRLVDAWVANVRKLRTSPSLIWQELEAA